MANGWMFLYYSHSTVEEITKHLQLLKERFPEVNVIASKIYQGSLMIEVPPPLILDVKNYIHQTSDNCDVSWV